MFAKILCCRVGTSTKTHSKRVAPDCAAHVLLHSVSVLSSTCGSWLNVLLGLSDAVCGCNMLLSARVWDGSLLCYAQVYYAEC
jgi:hypothetical protein